jgi:flagellar export protein FliJ
MTDSQHRLRRVDRLVEIRQTYVMAAEGRVREAEHQVRLGEETVAACDRQIQQVMAEIAYLDHSTGASIQNRERYIFTLHVRARQARESLDKARKTLEARMQEWSTAKRDQKVIEKLQERRLQEWKHSVATDEQKSVDEMTVLRHARNQSNRPNDRAGLSSAGSTIKSFG